MITSNPPLPVLPQEISSIQTQNNQQQIDIESKEIEVEEKKNKKKSSILFNKWNENIEKSPFKVK